MPCEFFISDSALVRAPADCGAFGLIAQELGISVEDIISTVSHYDNIRGGIVFTHIEVRNFAAPAMIAAPGAGGSAGEGA